MGKRKKNIFMQLYKSLLKKFGKQNWWPLIENGKITYKGKKNLDEREKFEVMVGALLTQNTTWKNAEKALLELYNADLLSINKIIKVKDKILEEKIKSSGYYRQKAKKLKALAKFLQKNPIAKLEKIESKKLRKMLLNVYGIGKETADSILLYAFNRPIFIVDVYARRLFVEYGLIFGNETYDEIREMVEENFPRDVKMLKEFHALIVEYGKNKKTKNN